MAVTLMVTGCSGVAADDVQGKVDSQRIDIECKKKKGKHRCQDEHELVVRNQGDLVEVEVSREVYEQCITGSTYPRCAED